MFSTCPFLEEGLLYGNKTGVSSLYMKSVGDLLEGRFTLLRPFVVKTLLFGICETRISFLGNFMVLKF